jgi:hypothetical protein
MPKPPQKEPTGAPPADEAKDAPVLDGEPPAEAPQEEVVELTRTEIKRRFKVARDLFKAVRNSVDGLRGIEEHATLVAEFDAFKKDAPKKVGKVDTPILLKFEERLDHFQRLLADITPAGEEEGENEDQRKEVLARLQIEMTSLSERKGRLTSVAMELEKELMAAIDALQSDVEATKEAEVTAERLEDFTQRLAQFVARMEQLEAGIASAQDEQDDAIPAAPPRPGEEPAPAEDVAGSEEQESGTLTDEFLKERESRRTGNWWKDFTTKRVFFEGDVLWYELEADGKSHKCKVKNVDLTLGMVELEVLTGEKDQRGESVFMSGGEEFERVIGIDRGYLNSILIEEISKRIIADSDVTTINWRAISNDMGIAYRDMGPVIRNMVGLGVLESVGDDTPELQINPRELFINRQIDDNLAFYVQKDERGRYTVEGWNSLKEFIEHYTSDAVVADFNDALGFEGDDMVDSTTLRAYIDRQPFWDRKQYERLMKSTETVAEVSSQTYAELGTMPEVGTIVSYQHRKKDGSEVGEPYKCRVDAINNGSYVLKPVEGGRQPNAMKAETLAGRISPVEDIGDASYSRKEQADMKKMLSFFATSGDGRAFTFQQIADGIKFGGPDLRAAIESARMLGLLRRERQPEGAEDLYAVPGTAMENVNAVGDGSKTVLDLHEERTEELVGDINSVRFGEIIRILKTKNVGHTFERRDLERWAGVRRDDVTLYTRVLVHTGLADVRRVQKEWGGKKHWVSEYIISDKIHAFEAPEEKEEDLQQIETERRQRLDNKFTSAVLFLQRNVRDAISTAPEGTDTRTLDLRITRDILSRELRLGKDTAEVMDMLEHVAILRYDGKNKNHRLLTGSIQEAGEEGARVSYDAVVAERDAQLEGRLTSIAKYNQLIEALKGTEEDEINVTLRSLTRGMRGNPREIERKARAILDLLEFRRVIVFSRKEGAGEDTTLIFKINREVLGATDTLKKETKKVDRRQVGYDASGGMLNIPDPKDKRKSTHVRVPQFSLLGQPGFSRDAFSKDRHRFSLDYGACSLDILLVKSDMSSVGIVKFDGKQQRISHDGTVASLFESFKNFVEGVVIPGLDSGREKVDGQAVDMPHTYNGMPGKYTGSLKGDVPNGFGEFSGELSQGDVTASLEFSGIFADGIMMEGDAKNTVVQKGTTQVIKGTLMGGIPDGLWKMYDGDGNYKQDVEWNFDTKRFVKHVESTETEEADGVENEDQRKLKDRIKNIRQGIFMLVRDRQNAISGGELERARKLESSIAAWRERLKNNIDELFDKYGVKDREYGEVAPGPKFDEGAGSVPTPDAPPAAGAEVRSAAGGLGSPAPVDAGAATASGTATGAPVSAAEAAGEAAPSPEASDDEIGELNVRLSELQTRATELLAEVQVETYTDEVRSRVSSAHEEIVSDFVSLHGEWSREEFNAQKLILEGLENKFQTFDTEVRGLATTGDALGEDEVVEAAGEAAPSPEASDDEIGELNVRLSELQTRATELLAEVQVETYTDEVRSRVENAYKDIVDDTKPLHGSWTKDLFDRQSNGLAGFESRFQRLHEEIRGLAATGDAVGEDEVVEAGEPGGEVPRDVAHDTAAAPSVDAEESEPVVTVSPEARAAFNAVPSVDAKPSIEVETAESLPGSEVIGRTYRLYDEKSDTNSGQIFFVRDVTDKNVVLQDPESLDRTKVKIPRDEWADLLAGTHEYKIRLEHIQNEDTNDQGEAPEPAFNEAYWQGIVGSDFLDTGKGMNMHVDSMTDDSVIVSSSDGGLGTFGLQVPILREKWEESIRSNAFRSAEQSADVEAQEINWESLVGNQYHLINEEKGADDLVTVTEIRDDYIIIKLSEKTEWGKPGIIPAIKKDHWQDLVDDMHDSNYRLELVQSQDAEVEVAPPEAGEQTETETDWESLVGNEYTLVHEEKGEEYNVIVKELDENYVYLEVVGAPDWHPAIGKDIWQDVLEGVHPNGYKLESATQDPTVEQAETEIKKRIIDIPEKVIWDMIGGKLGKIVELLVEPSRAADAQVYVQHIFADDLDRLGAELQKFGYTTDEFLDSWKEEQHLAFLGGLSSWVAFESRKEEEASLSSRERAAISTPQKAKQLAAESAPVLGFSIVAGTIAGLATGGVAALPAALGGAALGRFLKKKTRAIRDWTRGISEGAEENIAEKKEAAIAEKRKTEAFKQRLLERLEGTEEEGDGTGYNDVQLALAAMMSQSVRTSSHAVLSREREEEVSRGANNEILRETLLERIAIEKQKAVEDGDTGAEAKAEEHAAKMDVVLNGLYNTEATMIGELIQKDPTILKMLRKMNAFKNMDFDELLGKKDEEDNPEIESNAKLWGGAILTTLGGVAVGAGLQSSAELRMFTGALAGGYLGVRYGHMRDREEREKAFMADITTTIKNAEEAITTMDEGSLVSDFSTEALLEFTTSLRLPLRLSLLDSNGMLKARAENVMRRIEGKLYEGERDKTMDTILSELDEEYNDLLEEERDLKTSLAKGPGKLHTILFGVAGAVGGTMVGMIGAERAYDAQLARMTVSKDQIEAFNIAKSKLAEARAQVAAAHVSTVEVTAPPPDPDVVIAPPPDPIAETPAVPRFEVTEIFARDHELEDYQRVYLDHLAKSRPELFEDPSVANKLARALDNPIKLRGIRDFKVTAFDSLLEQGNSSEAIDMLRDEDMNIMAMRHLKAFGDPRHFDFDKFAEQYQRVVIDNGHVTGDPSPEAMQRALGKALQASGNNEIANAGLGGIKGDPYLHESPRGLGSLRDRLFDKSPKDTTYNPPAPNVAEVFPPEPNEVPAPVPDTGSLLTSGETDFGEVHASMDVDDHIATLVNQDGFTVNLKNVSGIHFDPTSNLYTVTPEGSDDSLLYTQQALFGEQNFANEETMAALTIDVSDAEEMLASTQDTLATAAARQSAVSVGGGAGKGAIIGALAGGGELMDESLDRKRKREDKTKERSSGARARLEVVDTREPVASKDERFIKDGRMVFEYDPSGTLLDIKLERSASYVGPAYVIDKLFEDEDELAGIEDELGGAAHIFKDLDEDLRMYEELTKKGELSTPAGTFIREYIHKNMQKLADNLESSPQEIFTDKKLEEFGFEVWESEDEESEQEEELPLAA